jgi:hypothetical protein
MTMTEVEKLLKSLLRNIDNKTTLTVEQRPDADRPGVTVRLSRDKRTGSLQFTDADLIAAQTDLAARNRLRTALKRTRDRMWEETTYIFSTKVEHQKGEGMQWFRPQQGGRGGRR